KSAMTPRPDPSRVVTVRDGLTLLDSRLFACFGRILNSRYRIAPDPGACVAATWGQSARKILLARGRPGGWHPTMSASTLTSTSDVDVVVIGAGNAGLT